MKRTQLFALFALAAFASQGLGGCASAANQATKTAAVSKRTIKPPTRAGATKDISNISANQTVTGQITTSDGRLSDGTYYDVWTFQANAGDYITVDMVSDDFDALLKIGTGGGETWEELAEDDDSGDGFNPRISGEITEAGTYHIIANTASGDATGAYALRLQVTRGSVAQNSTPAQPQQSGGSVNYAALYPGGGDPNDRYALLVGIDDYPGTESDLGGVPVKDAYAMRDVLVNKFGFKQQNIVILLDERATRDQIANAFIRHLGQAGPNGVAVFYYSGHGMQLRQNVATAGAQDIEDDGVDEALYIYGSDEASTVLVDDEIGYLASQLRTDRLLLIFDACHSGTGSRSPDAQMKAKVVDYDDVSRFLTLPAEYFPAAVSKGNPSAASSKGINDAGAGPAHHLLLAASTNREVSWTAGGWPNRGGSVSVFTYYLAEELDASNASTTWSDLMQRVQQRTLNYTVNRMQEEQTPQLEGTQSTARVYDFLGKR